MSPIVTLHHPPEISAPYCPPPISYYRPLSPTSGKCTTSIPVRRTVGQHQNDPTCSFIVSIQKLYNHPKYAQRTVVTAARKYSVLARLQIVQGAPCELVNMVDVRNPGWHE